MPRLAILRRFASALLTALLLHAGALSAQSIALPAPRGEAVPVNRILANRRDTTAFSPTGLSQQTVSDLLWAACGINRPATGHRTSNYSHTSRDTELYLLCAQGVFLYDQLQHALTLKSATDLRSSLGEPAATAPVTLVLATFSTNVDFFGAIHTGLVSENIALACADRSLGAHLTATIPSSLPSALGLGSDRSILLLQTIGIPAGAPGPAPAWAVAPGPLVAAAINDTPALQILKRRRSTRNFASTAFSTQTLADLLWAGLGIANTETGERTAPLVAGVHDIDLYVARAGGVFIYRPGNGSAHFLAQVSTEEVRDDLGYPAVPAIFIYVADFAKLSGTDAQKQRISCLHAGHVAQNVAACIAAEGLGELIRSSVTVTASALQLTASQRVLFTQTLGYPSSTPGASTVTFAAGPGGTITGTASQSIAFGAAGTPVAAQPAPGNLFAYWSGLPGGRVATNPLTVRATDSGVIEPGELGVSQRPAPERQRVDSASPPVGSIIATHHQARDLREPASSTHIHARVRSVDLDRQVTAERIQAHRDEVGTDSVAEPEMSVGEGKVRLGSHCAGK